MGYLGDIEINFFKTDMERVEIYGMLTMTRLI